MTEFSCYFSSVLGLFFLRAREARKQTEPSIRQPTWTGNPIIFTVVSGMLILRVVITQPLQGLAILSVQLLGLVVFYSRFGFRGPRPPV